MGHEEVQIPVERDVVVSGDLVVPELARGVVIFAHGSGSSRFSSRNQSVARVLNDAGFATLLLDLLTEREERIDDVTRELRFDIPFLAGRVVAAIDWATRARGAHGLSIGLFGASTGAAAALVAAAHRPLEVAAIVSRGGRPDLADDSLARVRAPTLLIVGANDPEVLTLNERAYARLQCVRDLSIVPRATHLFEEPGTLEQVSSLASRWFERFLDQKSWRPSLQG